MLCLFNSVLKLSLVFNLFGLSIGFKISVAVFVLPLLWMFSDINNFQVFIPYSFSNANKQLNDLIKDFFTLNILHIHFFDGFH